MQNSAHNNSCEKERRPKGIFVFAYIGIKYTGRLCKKLVEVDISYGGGGGWRTGGQRLSGSEIFNALL